MSWNASLAFTVTPKSGPLRQMNTLLDASHALTHDLPKHFLQRCHWWKVGWLVCHAADTGAQDDILDATNEIAEALDAEGWMDLTPRITADFTEAA